MFALLRSVFQKKELEDAIKKEISPEILCEIYKLAQKHDLGHLIAQALEDNGLMLGTPCTEKFLEKRGMAVFRVEQIQYELAEIYAVFEEAKIKYLPLKGAVIRGYYPENWYRTCCDIDILVKEEKIEEAIRALETRLGYSNQGKAYHDVSMLAPSGVHLELHFNILEHQPNIDGLLSRVWEYAQKADEGYKYVMSEEFLLFHIIAHSSYHFLKGGCGVRPILDLYILEKHMRYDKERLATMLEECGLTKYYEGLLTLSSAWFEGEQLKESFQYMEGYILDGGVYGNMQNYIALEQAKKGGKGKYIRHRIFMPYEDLKTQYLSLNEKKWLTPFYQIRRWGRLFFGNRLKKSVREARINSSILEEEKLKVKEMMQALELL